MNNFLDKEGTERIMQYAHSQPNENVRIKFENMAEELKNIVPMNKES